MSAKGRRSTCCLPVSVFIKRDVHLLQSTCTPAFFFFYKPVAVCHRMAAHFTSPGTVVTPTATTFVHRSKGQSLLRVTTEMLVYFHCVRVQGRWLQNLKIKSAHQCFLLIFNCSQQHSLACVEAFPRPLRIQTLMNPPCIYLSGPHISFHLLPWKLRLISPLLEDPSCHPRCFPSHAHTHAHTMQMPLLTPSSNP